MRIKLLLGKRLSQRINNVLISEHFLYDYISPTNDFSNKVVSSKYVFRCLMRPWFLCLLNGSIVITIQRYWINNFRHHFKFLDELPYPDHFLIQTTSLAASEASLYSASVVESAIVSYLELF